MYSSAIIERNLARLSDSLGVKLQRYDDSLVEEMTASLVKLVKGYDKEGRPDKWARQPNVQEQSYIDNERVMCKYDFEYFAKRYCNPPEAPIWMADGSFKPIGEIRVGEQVIGWGKQPTTKTSDKAKGYYHATKRSLGGVSTVPERFLEREGLCTATVLAIRKRVAPIVAVTLASGTVIKCTSDHLWSNADTTSSNKWVTVCQPKPGKGTGRNGRPPLTRKLRRFIEPVGPIPNHLRETAAWLAGIYDGEGSCSTTGILQISQSEEHNPLVCRAIEAALGALGFDYRRSTQKHGATSYCLRGGRQALTKFLLWCRPIRSARILSAILGFCDSAKDNVTSIQECGIGEVVSMMTSTGNYVAWGYASKNCYIELAPIEGKPSSGVGRLGSVGFMRPQEVLLEKLAKAEEEMYEAADKGHLVDGLRYFINKARQLHFTAICRLLSNHRVLFWPDTLALAASVNEDMTGELYRRDKVLFDNLPWFLKPQVEYDTKNQQFSFSPLGSQTLYHQANQHGGMGMGRMVPVAHMTECAFWDDMVGPNTLLRKLDYHLRAAIPQSLHTLYLLESTSNGIGGWWYDQIELIRQKKSSFKLHFCPWYAADKKYRRYPPEGWEPDEYTKAVAERAERTSPEYFDGRTIRLDKEQLYWYQTELEGMSGRLAVFFSNYPTDLEEAFQMFEGAAFSPELLMDLRRGIGQLYGSYDIFTAI